MTRFAGYWLKCFPSCFLLVVSSLIQVQAQSDRPLVGPAKIPPIQTQFEHLSTEDGLSSNTVTVILQDRDGYLWFGTEDGLNKYDGATFTIFRPNPAQPARSLQNGYIMGLSEGDSTRLWVATRGGGLHELNRKTGEMIPHPIRAAQATRWNNQISVYTDRQNQVWISTFAGLARYNPARHHFTLYPSPIPNEPVVTVFEDPRNRFWVATHRGLYLLDRATGHFTAIIARGLNGPQPAFGSFYLDANDVLWLGTATEGYCLFKLDLRSQPWNPVPYNPVGGLSPYVWRNTIHRDPAGLVWVGTGSGLYAIDPATDRVATYRSNPNQHKGLASSNAQAVFHDRSGTLWVGTDNGIDRQSGNARPFRIYQVKPNERMASMPENRAYAVFKDQRGQIWFNTSPVLYRLSADGKRLESIPPQRLGAGFGQTSEVTAFLPDSRNGIWLGSYGGLYHYDHVSGQYTGYPSEIPAQFIAKQAGARISGTPVWIGGDGGFASFDPVTHQYTYYKYQPGAPNGIPDKDVYGLLVSRTGEVWILINHLGVCRFNPRTGRMVRYFAGSKGHLSSNDVFSMYEDRDGVVWVGTYLGGLNRYDAQKDQFTAITHKDGIPGNSIVGITGDDSGQLWLSTNAGLCRLNPRTKALRVYQVSDGLPSTNFKHNAVCRVDGQLLFGTENGIVQFTPAEVRDDTRPFPVHITSLKVMDKPRAFPGNAIRLNHDEKMISIGFAALAYDQPTQNQYAYRLIGINNEWIQNGNRTVASFTSLPPGRYTFQVKAANSNGFWTKEIASLQLTVDPPWWASWWAYGLYLVLVAGTIWGIVHFYIHRLRQRQELELNRRQAEQLKALDELKTRFFSNITHEFRTPLSLIIAPVEKLLEENRFDRPTMTLIQRNAEQLLRLINQLLDLAKLDSDRMPVAALQGQVSSFIEEIVAMFQPAAELKTIRLMVSLADFPPQEHLFDADKWEKVLINLLANALKFTNEGGHITLTSEPVWNDQEMVAVQFRLADSGVGIAREHLPHIFNRFYQADTSTTRTYEGTGLGLSLVHELVELMGGTIRAESQVGVGTTFHWTLPVGQAATAGGMAPTAWVPSDSLEPDTLVTLEAVSAGSPTELSDDTPQILIVEDNEELLSFLATDLAHQYRVLTATNGVEGWKLAQAELPDLVLSDVMMPFMDGFELTQRIKTHPDTDHIPVVLLSARSARTHVLSGLERGADEYLPKPFDLKALHLRLHNLLTRQERLRERYRQQFMTASVVPQVEEPEENPLLVQIYGLLDAHLDNPELNVEWLAGQLKINRRTLYRKVTSLTPWTPNDLIRRYRLRQGARLLLQGAGVSDTAYRVGFETPTYFGQCFKEVYGLTPSDWLKQPQQSAERQNLTSQL